MLWQLVGQLVFEQHSSIRHFFISVIWLVFALACPVRADDVTTVVDDSDPGIKALHGNWVHFKGQEYYNGTETLTRNANAVSMYIFNGS
jgi:hypothetical protein